MTRELYQLGRVAIAMPIPPVLERCRVVDAGPVRFVIEPRQYDTELMAQAAAEQGREALPHHNEGLYDYGASLHVLGTDDGLEHLRFDCFEDYPHYHYIDHDKQENLVCRFDENAEGDPAEWTLRCMRNRLPEMLTQSGVPLLGEAARHATEEIVAGVDQVVRAMQEAAVEAKAEGIARAEARKVKSGNH